MKAVRVVLDDALLKRLDRIARRRKLSRSAVIRETLERALQSEQMDALVERERASYEKYRTTDEERETHELLKRAAATALSQLDEEAWCTVETCTGFDSTGVPSQVRVGPGDGVPKESAINLRNVYTLDRADLGPYITSLRPSVMAQVDAALVFALGVGERTEVI